MGSDLLFYGELLIGIKDRIRQGQIRSALSANAEMIAMYWDIGRMIHQRQKEKGWGAGVIPLRRMNPQLCRVSLHKFPGDTISCSIFSLSRTVSRAGAGNRVGPASGKIPAGTGGRVCLCRASIPPGSKRPGFYLDLLFYHLKLRCFIVIELKKGDFKPEYAGKMNFYCSAVDDLLSNKTDQPTMGLILCQTKDRILAEYSLRDVHKPIGISDYELTRALPENYERLQPIYTRKF